MGGGPASGKSSVIRTGKVTIPKNAVPVDSDDIKKKIPEFGEMIKAKDKSAAGFVHEESSSLSKQVYARSVGEGYNTLLDGTGDSSIEKLRKKVNQARDAGSKVVANYMTVNTDEAVSRAMKRAEKTGRMVPEPVIRGTHKQVSVVVPKAIKEGLFDDFQLWDNNGSGPVLVASAKGKKLDVANKAMWDAFLAKGDE